MSGRMRYLRMVKIAYVVPLYSKEKTRIHENWRFFRPSLENDLSFLSCLKIIQICRVIGIHFREFFGSGLKVEYAIARNYIEEAAYISICTLVE